MRGHLRPGTGRLAGGATRRPPARPGAVGNATGGGLRSWLEDAHRLDLAVYAAAAATPMPTMDEGLRRLSGAADRSKLWVGCSAVLAAIGGRAAGAPPRTGWRQSRSPRPSSTWV